MSLLNTFTLLLVVALDLFAQHDRFGIPACSGTTQEFADRSFFVICHSSSQKVPLWVGYELTPEQLKSAATRPAHFRHDPDLSSPGAYDSDYKNSGYSRGHMAPAADFAFSQASIRSTFLLSNAVPQRQAVNQGRWAQLETAVRRIAAASRFRGARTRSYTATVSVQTTRTYYAQTVLWNYGAELRSEGRNALRPSGFAGAIRRCE
jgi:DNA/RNA non-specific endonuclease